MSESVSESVSELMSVSVLASRSAFQLGSALVSRLEFQLVCSLVSALESLLVSLSELNLNLGPDQSGRGVWRFGESSKSVS